jgi:AmmeMemoRadiSam system protein B
MYRKAVVKNRFYTGNVEELISFFESSFSDKKIEEVKCAIVPHAGYIYSGRTAFKTLSSINITDTVLLLGPNHTGLGERVAVFCDGSWETPFGDVKVDKELAKALVDSENIYEDYTAHLYEHCLEVILPMLKYLNSNVKIVPIVFSLLSYNEALIIGNIIAEQLKKKGKNILIIVSSDMNHYEDSVTTLNKDKMAINAIIRLDTKKLYEAVAHYNISMCGFVPAIVAIESCKMMGATEGFLIEHTDSGEYSGDTKEVVGYAGIVIK